MNTQPQDTDSLDYKISVMQAAREGKEIEYKWLGYDSGWNETETPAWDWNSFTYRVKPEPVVVHLGCGVTAQPDEKDVWCLMSDGGSELYLHNKEIDALKELADKARGIAASVPQFMPLDDPIIDNMATGPTQYKQDIQQAYKMGWEDYEKALRNHKGV